VITLGMILAGVLLAIVFFIGGFFFGAWAMERDIKMRGL